MSLVTGALMELHPHRPTGVSSVLGRLRLLARIALFVLLVPLARNLNAQTYILVSAVNYSPGQTRANNGVVSIDANGAFTVRCGQATGLVHLIVDINGYFVE
jgi:hypothetical protein